MAIDHELLRLVKKQASDCMGDHEHTPWAWYRLMKLQDAINDVLGDIDNPMNGEVSVKKTTHLTVVESPEAG